MKVTIAAKRVVILLMTMALAVAMVACQGAVGQTGDKGPKGDKGDKGDPGTSGPPGEPGTDGINALATLPDPPVVLINDGMEGASAVVGALPTGLSASSYFRGGRMPLTFKAERVDNEIPVNATNDDDAGTEKSKSFDLTVDEMTGAITIEERATPVAATTPAAPDDTVYNVGDWFEITATDDDGFEADVIVKVLRNRAPTKTTSGSIVTAATTAVVVGTQDGIELDTDNKEQTSDDACDVTDKDRLNVLCFTKAEVEAAFNVDMDTDVIYMVRSKNPAYASASITSDGKLVITGHKPLLDDAVAQDIKLFLKAVDSKDLASEEHEILVNVDPMPVLGSLPSSLSVKATGEATEGVIRGISTGFVTSMDQANAAESVTVQLVVPSGENEGNGAATVSNAYFSASIDSDGLNITGNNQTLTGSQPLVILVEETGSDPIQWVKHTVMVSVTAP